MRRASHSLICHSLRHRWRRSRRSPPRPNRSAPRAARTSATTTSSTRSKPATASRTVGGNLGKYRSDVNYGNGIRLLGSSLTVNSRDGHGGLFDEIVLTTLGLGNDPYQSAVAARAEEPSLPLRHDVAAERVLQPGAHGLRRRAPHGHAPPLAGSRPRAAAAIALQVPPGLQPQQRRPARRSPPSSCSTAAATSSRSSPTCAACATSTAWAPTRTSGASASRCCTAGTISRTTRRSS